MKLKQLGLINWANLENRNYTFADINLISGSSGAGKTTLLDALQTALTAAAHNIVHYNPGQEEATQHSRSKETRSIASYILGCDDGKYARLHPTCGYILAVFHPEAGEDSVAFTALVGASARIDSVGSKRVAKLIDEIYAILPGTCLEINDIVIDNDGQKEIVLIENLTTHLALRHRDCKLEPATTKEEYLRQLYGAFLGKKLANKLEARNAAKQLVKFMAYKPEANLDNFVRNAILEPKDMSEAIEQIQSMMKTIFTMEREATHIEEGISYLHSANRHLGNLIDSQLKQQSATYELRIREAYQNRKFSSEENRRIKTIQSEILQLNADIETHTSERRLVQDSLRQFEARKQGITPLQEQERLLKEKTLSEDNIGISGKLLLTSNVTRSLYRKHIEALFHALGKGDAWVPDQSYAWKQKIKSIRENDNWDDIQLSHYLQDINKIAELKSSASTVNAEYHEFIQQISNSKNLIYEEFLKSRDELDHKQKRHTRLEKEIAQMLDANRVVYREDTERALRLIRQQLPDANPQVICDHIEITAPEWQAAIEAFMGENRFLLVVDSEYEIEALNLAKQHGLRSSLVQGTKAVRDAGKRTVLVNTIYDIAEFSHETVRAYFLCAYGDVLQVEEENKLRTTRRGLMTDGRASSSYKLFVARINEDDLKLGKGARQRALQAKKTQLRKLANEIQFAEIKKRSMTHWRNLLDQESSFDLSSPIQDLLEAHKQLHYIDEQLSKLDLTEFKDLLKEIKQSQSTLNGIEKSLLEFHKTLGNNEEKLKNAQVKLSHHEAQAEKADDDADAELLVLEKMSNYFPDFIVDELVDQVEEKLISKDSVNALDEAEIIGQRRARQLKGISDSLTQFNSMNLQNITVNFKSIIETAKSEQKYDVVQSFATTTDVQRQTDIAYNTLENNILAAHKKNLQEISQSFNKTFIGHLCHTLYNYLDQGEQQLRNLNRKLTQHIFGEEYYEFKFTWLPEFKEYWEFLKEATGINLDSDGGLFSEQSLSEESYKVFDRIRSLLLSEDLEKSKKELKRITDYRNYRAYDILKVLPNPDDESKPHKISLKSYGTGSGGQMETPSYVIRAAALASALKLDSSRSNLKTLMIDESFGKMDEARSKAILKYLNQTLGFQILFVIPSKSSGPFHDVVDQVIEVTKVESPKPRGELHTRVHLTINVMNKERVAKLWEQEKIQIRNQASLFDFNSDDNDDSPKEFRALQ